MWLEASQERLFLKLARVLTSPFLCLCRKCLNKHVMKSPSVSPQYKLHPVGENPFPTVEVTYQTEAEMSIITNTSVIIYYTLLARTFSIVQLTPTNCSHFHSYQTRSQPGEEGFLLIFQPIRVQHHLCFAVTGLLCDLCRVSTLPETPLRAW